jgi:hypothetical protein
MWRKRIKIAWSTYRHVVAFKGLLEFLGLWKWIALAGAIAVGALTAVWLTLPLYSRFLIGLGGTALSLFLAGFGVCLVRIVRAEQNQDDKSTGQPNTELSEALMMVSPELLKIRIVSGASCNATGDGLIIYLINGRDDPIQPSSISVIDAASFNSRTSRFRTTENFELVHIASYLKTPAGETAKQPFNQEATWLAKITGNHLDLIGHVARTLKWPADDTSTREVWSLALSVKTNGRPAWNPKLRIEWDRGSKIISISPL